jgi:PAS domain S-box-containing protein
MTLPLLPIWIADLVGSSLMILFSFLCVRLARQLKDQDPNNVVWTYLLWLSWGLAGFAISRSVGHIAKRLLMTTGYVDLWDTLKPYSGAINTLAFAVVASVTLFFERIWKTYQQILKDKQALQEAHGQLLFLNRNLESLVAERAQELAVSERKYRRIFEVSRDMILVADGDGKIVDINPAGTEMLGSAQAVDFADRAYFNDFFREPEEWKSIERALQSKGYVSDTEVLLRRNNEASFSALLSGTAESRDDGKVDSIHFLVKDISQRKAMQNQLLQADKLASIGQLAAGIAHEINNPLSMILGYTQLLLRTEDQGTQRQADLRIIEKHARTCKTIVGDLLSFARGARTRKGVAHIHSTIEEILSVVQHHVKLDGIEIERDFDPQVPKMVLDEEKIKQVFMNLIMNAKQAIGKKGTIRLRTRYDEPLHQVVVQVSDTGSGIEPEHLSRIFDPFFTTKGTGEGTGLGLSVSYGIVKDHGGEILVESEPEKGSTFTLILPVTLEEIGTER